MIILLPWMRMIVLTAPLLLQSDKSVASIWTTITTATRDYRDGDAPCHRVATTTTTMSPLATKEILWWWTVPLSINQLSEGALSPHPHPKIAASTTITMQQQRERATTTTTKFFNYVGATTSENHHDGNNIMMQ